MKNIEVCIRNREKQWAGNITGNIGLPQVNVNIDLINTKLCWLSLTRTHSHSLHPLMASLSYKSFSSVLFWEGGYFAQRRNYNGFPNPFSPLNYSDVTKPHYTWKCSQVTVSGSYMCLYVCVFTVHLPPTVLCFVINKEHVCMCVYRYTVVGVCLSATVHLCLPAPRCVNTHMY